MRFVALVAALAVSSAFAQGGPSLTAWQPGPGAQGDNTYLGVIDTPSSGASISTLGPLTVSGWFVDTAAEGWAGADDVQVFLGTMDSGGTLLAHGSVGQDRPDVGETLGNAAWQAAGWQASLDPGALPFGQSTLSVYLHTPGKGWWFVAVPVVVGRVVPGTGEILAPAPAAQGDAPSLTITAPREGEVVSTRLRAYTISGTATDPAHGARGIDWVDIWLNGEANSDKGIFLGSLTLDSDGTWSVNFDPDTFPAIDSNVYAYAHSAATGKTTLKVVHFSLENRPV